VSETEKRYEYEDDYESIRVEDDLTANHRLLIFEDSIQGILNLDAPHEPVLEYVSHSRELLDRWFQTRTPRNLLLGGVGAAAIHHMAAHRFHHLPQIGVDSNERVIELATQWFQVPSTITFVHEDFRLALMDYSNRDIIVVDCYTALSVPPPLLTSEFKKSVRLALSETGIALFNLWNGQEHELFFSQLKTLIEIFGKVALYPCESDGNIVAAVSKADLDCLESEKVRLFDHQTAESTFVEYVEADVITDSNLSIVLETFGLGI
jgi:spermidine synthase